MSELPGYSNGNEDRAHIWLEKVDLPARSDEDEIHVFADNDNKDTQDSADPVRGWGRAAHLVSKERHSERADITEKTE